MNKKELDEIIDLLFIDDLSISCKRKLTTYITNLQEENERLKEQLDMLVKDDEKQQKIIIDLQHRIDKAIEYCEETLDLKEEYNNEVECVVNDLLDILRGKDE